MTTTTKQTPVIQRPVAEVTPPFLPGDILLFAGEHDLYSKVGGWLMRGEQEGPTYAVHTAQFIAPEQVLEMDFVAEIKSLDDVLNRRYKLETWKRRGFEVWRCVTLTEEDRAALTRQALSYLDVKFSMRKLLAHLFDNLLCKVAHRNIFFFRRFGPPDRYLVCSGITAFVYDRSLNYRFGVEPACADPDHIHDWVTSHPAEWVRVYCLEEYQEGPARQVSGWSRLVKLCKELLWVVRR